MLVHAEVVASGCTSLSARQEGGMRDVLARETTIVVSGTVENPVKFYDRFEHMVLLSGPIDTLIERSRL